MASPERIHVGFGGTMYNFHVMAEAASIMQSWYQIHSDPRLVAHGVSGGTIAAAAMAAGICARDLYERVIAAGVHFGVPRHKRVVIPPETLMHIIDRALPPDMHVRVNGRLVVYMTCPTNARAYSVSQFRTRADLVRALVCCVSIPSLNVKRPIKIDGRAVVDMFGSPLNYKTLLDKLDIHICLGGPVIPVSSVFVRLAAKMKASRRKTQDKLSTRIVVPCVPLTNFKPPTPVETDMQRSNVVMFFKLHEKSIRARVMKAGFRPPPATHVTYAHKI